MAKQIAVRVTEENGGKLLCPWKFIRVSQAFYSYSQLWNDILDGAFSSTFKMDIPCKNWKFCSASAASALASNEQVRGDANTDLIETVNIFGMRFFTVTIQHSTPCGVCQPPPAQPPPNAFQILVSAARNAAYQDLPQPILEPKNASDRLTNAILAYFQEKNCSFPRSAGSTASRFLSKLTDLLFYMDGQYSKMEAVISRTKQINPVFEDRFSGFNCPQKSKHKKRTLNNLSEGKLESYTVQMREIMQGLPCLNSMPWAEVKMNIVDLLDVIEQYRLRLRGQRMRSKLVQETPRSRLETETNVTVVQPNKGNVHHSLADLDKEL